MIITINPYWRLASDPLQWILQRRKPRRGEPDEWRALEFHKSLDGAVLALVRRRIRILPGGYGPEALKPLVTSLDQLRDDIRAALESFQTEAAVYAGRAGQ